MKILFIVGIVLAIAIIMPIATIWSLNTLFPALAIPVSFDTWMAALILGGVVGGSTGLSFKK
jgi:Zn-dependent membrane protease YugP